MKVLLIDNYDSFTYNLFHYISKFNCEVDVIRNDKIKSKDIIKNKYKKIVISPGPCTPNEAGISVETISYFADKLPILGICLGHQSIAQAFGGKIVRAKQVMHGKTSRICHHNTGVFKGLSPHFVATRYHSLVIEQSTLPNCLEVTAWTENEDGSLDEIMGVRHKQLAIEGVQFHPESILTEHGHDLLRNFLES